MIHLTGTSDDVVTLAGNVAISAISIFAAFIVGKKLWRDATLGIGHPEKLSREARIFAIGVFMWSVGEFIRIGWWNPAIFFAPDGEKYHPFFTEWRGEMMLIATPLLVFGVTIAMAEIKDRGWQWVLGVGAAAFGVGIVVTLLRLGSFF